MTQANYHPSREQYVSQAIKGWRLPVYREILADLETPVTAYMKVATERSFLLESAEKGEAWSRYSFIGLEPAETLRFRDGRVEHTVGGAYRTGSSADPLAVLHQLVHEYPAVASSPLPRFWGGAVGYVAYDLVRSYERLPSLQPDELHLPDALFLVVDTVVIFDHLLGRMLLVSAPPVGEDAQASYDEAVRNINLVYNRLSAPLPRPPAPGGGLGSSAFKSNMPPQGFYQAVGLAKEYIARGDIFQVVLSLRLSAPLAADPFNLYRALRSINPSPYMGFLRLGEVTLVASSPESLVKCADGYLETRPIAGTRRRGASREEDERLRQELLGDEKERAEHVMLVDLGRNDTGRVSR
ncbi:MAG: chorismate-binding protein, partial [Deinococcus sp.]|nr:chorismate-binding protein [Deinococcus sp.]